MSMDINSLIDNIKYSVTSSKDGNVEICDNSFLLDLLKDNSDNSKRKETLTISVPWENMWNCRFPFTYFVLRLLVSVIEIFIYLVYYIIRLIRRLILGKKNDKDLSVSPRINFVVLISFLTFFIVAITFSFIFFIKSVLLFNPNSRVNDKGAIIIPQPCSVEHYLYLFNSAECWANTGIKVLKGDEIRISASGSYYSKISHMNLCAVNNEVLPYKRHLITCEPKEDTSLIKDLCIYKGDEINNARFGALLLQIKEDYEEPSYCSLDKLKPQIYQLTYNNEKGFLPVKAVRSGILNFAVNDIYFTNEVLELLQNSSNDNLLRSLDFSIMRLTKNSHPITVNTLKEVLGKDYKGLRRDMWFYDNVGEIMLSIKVTRMSISEEESMPSFVVKFYRWLEKELLQLSTWNIVKYFALTLLIIILYLSADHKIGAILRSKMSKTNDKESGNGV